MIELVRHILAATSFSLVLYTCTCFFFATVDLCVSRWWPVCQ